MKTISLILIAVPLILVACETTTDPKVRVVQPVVGGLETLGCVYVGTVGGSQAVASGKAAELGGDTMFHAALLTWSVYSCNPKTAAALRSRDEARLRVRITNRQDVVKDCKFLRNVSASSEEEARADTADIGGTVFYVISDTTRTAIEKQAGSTTTYNYEVRRLTGEAYRCEDPKP